MLHALDCLKKNQTTTLTELNSSGMSQENFTRSKSHLWLPVLLTSSQKREV